MPNHGMHGCVDCGGVGKCFRDDLFGVYVAWIAKLVFWIIGQKLLIKIDLQTIKTQGVLTMPSFVES